MIEAAALYLAKCAGRRCHAVCVCVLVRVRVLLSHPTSVPPPGRASRAMSSDPISRGQAASSTYQPSLLPSIAIYSITLPPTTD